MINNAVCPCVSAVVLYKSHSTVTELVKLNETVRNYSWFSLPLNIKKKKQKREKVITYNSDVLILILPKDIYYTGDRF